MFGNATVFTNTLEDCIKCYDFEGNECMIFTDISIPSVQCSSFKALQSLWLIYVKLFILKTFIENIFAQVQNILAEFYQLMHNLIVE